MSVGSRRPRRHPDPQGAGDCGVHGLATASAYTEHLAPRGSLYSVHVARPEPHPGTVKQGAGKKVLPQQGAGNADAGARSDVGAVQVDLAGDLDGHIGNAVPLDPLQHLVALTAALEIADSDRHDAIERGGSRDAAFGLGVAGVDA